MFSTADWDEPYWTNKQHTATVLAGMGWRVLYVESVGLRTPRMDSRRDWSRLWRRLWRGLQSVLVGPPQRAPGIWVLSPLIVPAKHHWAMVRWFNQALLRATITRFARRHRFAAPLVWTYHPFMLDAVADVEHGPLVYHCVDDIAAVPGVDVRAFHAAERELLRRGDTVFATATALKERCEAVNPNTHFLPNVVDAGHFGRALEPGRVPEDVRVLSRPRLVYHGVLSDFKVDFALLLEAAQARPDWQWVLIGEEREGQRNAQLAKLRELPNVHLLGYRSYGELPDYLRAMDVGLLPTLLNDYTRSMFPMKFFEYLAAGLPVVSTPLSFTEHQTEGIEVGLGATQFVVAVEKQLARGRLTREEAARFVGDNTWTARTAKMLACVRSGGTAA
ncbi:glycosyltransferase [Cupriavidus sp. DB3]|uniref:glycosyltransferase n=1 Tax=Cupriavidus sp. DB3 TaxID=2873259 RepID=UPI001CF2D08B|nr:glycosyltransferase [Cupriavidus sp. DB3]MCA7085495.1 glycosyltransferase [Cupriavidus sp. DB3]